jgi:hypothetical protein
MPGVKGWAPSADVNTAPSRRNRRGWSDMHAELEAGTTDRRAGVEDRDVAALVVQRDDGTYTLAWGRGWGAFERLPGVWANEREAMRAVQQVVGPVAWCKAERRIWEGRLSADEEPTQPGG